MGINNRISQSVPHLYVHVVPRRSRDGPHGFFWPRQKYDSEDKEIQTQEAIRRELTASLK